MLPRIRLCRDGAQFSEIREMMAGRMSDVIEMAPFAGWSPTEMEYCRRISAYLAMMSLA